RFETCVLLMYMELVPVCLSSTSVVLPPVISLYDSLLGIRSMLSSGCFSPHKMDNKVCLPGDLTSGGSFVYSGAKQKNLTLRPKECRESPAVPLRKKKAGRVLNGLSLEPCKKTVHHQRSSDQENNPRL
ncbi:hypothetical protein KUCAC02_003799, partial [Chaenocephalus aceratus]